jgi:hypothetical protein
MLYALTILSLSEVRIVCTMYDACSVPPDIGRRLILPQIRAVAMPEDRPAGSWLMGRTQLLL